MCIISKLFKKTSPPNTLKDISSSNKMNRTQLYAEEEQLCKAFPTELREDVHAVFNLLNNNTIYNGRKLNGILGHYNEFVLNNELVQLPERIYYNELNDDIIATLTETQKTVLYCIFTRSYNGYLREKYVRLLLKTDYPQWAIPFIVKLCDDYVLEILTAIYELLKNKDTAVIKRFCLANKKAVRINYDRMLNYWYEYDKWTFPDFYEYVGRKLFRECLGYSRKLRKRKLYIKAYGQKSN